MADREVARPARFRQAALERPVSSAMLREMLADFQASTVSQLERHNAQMMEVIAFAQAQQNRDQLPMDATFAVTKKLFESATTHESECGCFRSTGFDATCFLE